jgi:hypothetical protein
MRIVIVAMSIALAIGCSKKSSDGVKLKQVNDALISAGFKLDTFREFDPSHFSAKTCASGYLDGVEAIVCEYGSPQSVPLGKQAGEDWIAQAQTGAVLTNGATLIALADRAHADPNGKIIHKITQAYRKTH